ncbi:MAG TPA: acetyl-CoA carboxylase biotin carboxyl carrier protein [Acidobacteriaceae bacterium]|jgi:acetyl-CoA carboxylase biotin carboxyl carrier protein|nr:acetyl-CoA carboxylase biotin carboxyl carrier protein [Acidobacteriaceae bacterium]
MKAEELKELKELIEFLKENKIGEFDLERGELKIRIKFEQEGGADLAGLAHALRTQAARTGPVQAASAPGYVPAAHAAGAITSAEAPAAAASDQDASLHVVKSPIVGTFYESPSPGSPAFVKIGDQVEVGQVLCIVEAMKLMNEIESDGAGEVVKRFVQNGQPVEYGQALFAVRSR